MTTFHPEELMSPEERREYMRMYGECVFAGKLHARAKDDLAAARGQLFGMFERPASVIVIHFDQSRRQVRNWQA